MSSKPLPQARGDVPNAQATCSSAGRCVGGHGRSPRDILHQYVWVCVTRTYPYQKRDFGSWRPRGCSGELKLIGSERPPPSPFVWHRFGVHPSSASGFSEGRSWGLWFFRYRMRTFRKRLTSPGECPREPFGTSYQTVKNMKY